MYGLLVCDWRHAVHYCSLEDCGLNLPFFEPGGKGFGRLLFFVRTFGDLLLSATRSDWTVSPRLYFKGWLKDLETLG